MGNFGFYILDGKLFIESILIEIWVQFLWFTPMIRGKNGLSMGDIKLNYKSMIDSK